MSEEFLDNLKSYKIPLGLCLLGIVLIAGGAYSSNLLSTPKTSSANKTDYVQKTVVSAQNTSQIKIDISGAVNKPGVYGLAADSRIEDAIKLAQGFSASASAEYVSKSLNLSQKISDGQKIYIPFEGEVAPVGTGLGGQVAGLAATSNSIKIGINTGTQTQLEGLPGVGPATATKIMGGRPYQSLEELRTKKSVSQSVFTKIKDLVDLN